MKLLVFSSAVTKKIKLFCRVADINASIVGEFEQFYRGSKLKPGIPEIRGSEDICCLSMSYKKLNFWVISCFKTYNFLSGKTDNGNFFNYSLIPEKGSLSYLCT